MRLMSDTLASAKPFTLGTDEGLMFIAPSGDNRSLYFTRKVAGQRPNKLFF
jgi:hypothetical protein